MENNKFSCLQKKKFCPGFSRGLNPIFCLLIYSFFYFLLNSWIRVDLKSISERIVIFEYFAKM